jgi:putative glycosyltransferase (TIGR04372 family)
MFETLTKVRREAASRGPRATIGWLFGAAKTRLARRLRRRGAYEKYRAFVDAGYKLVKLSKPQRIGHLCLEADCLLKETIMAGGDTKKLVLADVGPRFANRHVVDYFRRYLTIVDDDPAGDFIRTYGDPAGVQIETHPYAAAMYATARAYEVYARWGDRRPLFEASEEDREAALAFLMSQGMPQDSWFVCLHARSGGYSQRDEPVHKFRSVDISTYSSAMDEIAARGGWCVRMGDPSMAPMTPHPQMIDLATHPQKSPQLDIALVATCRFLLGSGSGLFNVAEMFGRPCAVAHMAPIACGYAFAPADISIFQRLADASGRVIPYAEILSREWASYRFNEEFEKAGLKNIPNSPEEIRALTIEMIDRLEGRFVATDDDRRRQEDLRSLFREGHYAFRAQSSIGRDFLRATMP